MRMSLIFNTKWQGTIIIRPTFAAWIWNLDNLKIPPCSTSWLDHILQCYNMEWSMKRIDLSVTANHGHPWSKEVGTYSEADCLRLHLQEKLYKNLKVTTACTPPFVPSSN
jgi:hypothetical protein